MARNTRSPVVYYLALLWMRARTSLTTGMQYRWDFLVDALMSVFWAGVSLMPLWVFGGTGRLVEGWSYPEMVIVTGWFVLLKGVVDGAINPSLLAVVEHIRQGTLDFVLLKPADAQFLVSTEKFDGLRLVDAVAGLLVIGHGFRLLGRAPSLDALLAAALLLLAAVAVLYAIWILVVCVAFFAVRLDNLSYLFISIFDFARWPRDIFKGSLRFIFTFVIPLALMTTFPSLALLGKLEHWHALAALAGALTFAGLARYTWRMAIAHYTSASS
jgi:ABC-2 type transport system permease protein